MNRLHQWLFVCLSMALICVACGEEDAGVATVEFTTIRQGVTHGIPIEAINLPVVLSPTVFQIDDEEALSAFWQHFIGSAVEQPDVDFEAQTVLGVIERLKSYSGDAFQVKRIARADHRLRIEVARQELGENCFRNGLMSQPYHVVSVPKTTIPAELELLTELIICPPVTPINCVIGAASMKTPHPFAADPAESQRHSSRQAF